MEKYTPKLRQKILERDKGKCQFPLYDEQRGWYFCNSMDRVQVHHIEPQRWAEFMLLQANVNEFANLITLCFYHHQSEVHPDMVTARADYGRQKKLGVTKPDSYERTLKKREEQLRGGEKYWNDDFDQFFRDRAEEQSKRVEVRNGKMYIAGKFIKDVEGND